MASYLDPKADVVFKKIFGQHPLLLKSFLNAVLPLPEDGQIESLTYLPSEQVPTTPSELAAYDKYWDAVSVEKTIIADSFEGGKAEGKVEGKAEERVQIAIEMLKQNFDDAMIMRITQLNATELAKLKQDLDK